MVPMAKGKDDGFGGVFRAAHGMARHLPKLGVEFVDQPQEADVIAAHIQFPPEWINQYGKPLVSHCHGLYWAEYEWPTWALSSNAEILVALRMADAVTVPSKWVERVVRRHTLRRPIVVEHGVDRKAFSPGEPNLGYVYWDKTRPDSICDPTVVNQLAAALPKTKFISTFGNDRDNVRITGRVPYLEAVDIMRYAGVYLATARESGTSFGLLQALASGTPVVGYRWGGQAEVIRSRDDGGVLVRPNDIAGLARATVEVLRDREELSVAARARALDFTWEKAAAKYAEVYRRVLEPHQGPRVSVIVTAYNLEKYLPETLESVRRQSFTDWECIVVDDASPDSCGAIAEAFAEKDGRFRVIHNRTNQYLSEARNIGIAASKGEYVLPLDADDWLPERALESLVASLDQDRRVHIAYGVVSFHKEDGTTEHGNGYDQGRSGWPIDFDWLKQLKNANCLPYSSMFRREVWEATGGYRPRVRTGEDADFWLRASSYGFRPKKVTNALTLHYRNRDDSMSRQYERPRFNRWFGWSVNSEVSPAGAVSDGQLPIPTLDPPAISIIIPVGPGHERMVMDAIDSVEAQDFSWYEVIVVNDTGKDLPLPLPAWVDVYTTAGRTGTAAARNLGIRNARAKLYLPLDADDLLEPGALTAWWEAAKQRPGVILYSDFWEQPLAGSPWSVWRAPNYRAQDLKVALHAVTALTPVDYWREVGGYNEDIAWEDWAFQLACADKGYCSARIGQPLFTYRKHHGRRREQNFGGGQGRPGFEQSKAGIMATFPHLWENGEWQGEKLMACGCNQNQTATLAQQAPGSGNSLRGGENMKLIQYIGNKTATVRFRGHVTGEVYPFSAGRIGYVHDDDAPIFLRSRDFQEVDEAPPAHDEPQLQSAQAPPADEPPPSDEWKRVIDPGPAPTPEPLPEPVVEESVHEEPVVEEPVVEEPDAQPLALPQTIANALAVAGLNPIDAPDDALLSVPGIGPAALRKIHAAREALATGA